MQRVKRATAVAVLPAAPGGGTPGYFALPNPGGGIPATVPGYEWYNGVQEELMAVIEGSGLAPDVTKNNQLATAIQSSSVILALAGGTADAITGSFVPVITALRNGTILSVRASFPNATTTPTFTPNSGPVAAKTIVKGNNLALVAGDVAGVGHWLELQYDVVLDKWILLNPATGTATVTAPNDATFVDNSVKPASTSWVRGAMATIATAAGFAYNFSSGNGCIKFPSWLGGFLIQCGSQSVAASTTTTYSFPITFPTQVWAILGSTAVPGSTQTVCAGIVSTSQYKLQNNYSGTESKYWLAVGN